VPEVPSRDAPGAFIARCKFFHAERGFGFLTLCDGPHKGLDVYVHFSALKPLHSRFKRLFDGEYVHTNLMKGPRGLQAVHVTGVLCGPLMCDTLALQRQGLARGDEPRAEYFDAFSPK
jgi:cold shock CspA family protein